MPHTHEFRPTSPRKSPQNPCEKPRKNHAKNHDGPCKKPRKTRASSTKNPRDGKIMAMAHMIVDSRTKQSAEGLDEPPFDSDFGKKIYENVSKKSWSEWIERQKM